MIDAEISRERWDRIREDAERAHEADPEKSIRECYWGAVDNHLAVLPNIVVDETVMGPEDVFGKDAIDAEWPPEDAEADR